MMPADYPRHPALAKGLILPTRPTTFQPSAAVLERYGDRINQLGDYLMCGDPLADELVACLGSMRRERGRTIIDDALNNGIDSIDRPPQPLVDFFTAIERIPPLIDFDQLNRGGDAFFRASVLAPVLLISYSLPLTYLDAAGNKPLVFSGQLLKKAMRRLMENVRFVLETCRHDGLRRYSPGFKITIKVRLMHAQIRRLLLQSGQWKLEEWGMPINQLFFAGTNTLFSAAILEGCTRLGVRFSDAEKQDMMQLWRYSGYLTGVDPAIQPVTYEEAMVLIQAFSSSSRPDGDSRTLTQALMDLPLALAPRPFPPKMASFWRDFGYFLSRRMIGAEGAAAMGYPEVPSGVRHLQFQLALGCMSLMCQSLKLFPALSRNVGERLWMQILELPAQTRGDGPPFNMLTQMMKLFKSPAEPTAARPHA